MSKDFLTGFIGRLETLGGLNSGSPDRRSLAALRRCLSTWPSAAPEAIRVVAPFIPENATGAWESQYYLIAALFALYPCASSIDAKRGPSLGKSLREAANKDPAQGPERRLLALLNCKSEDLPNHLRHAISYLRSKNVPVDYKRLMQDLNYWDLENGQVQKTWGRHFWSGSAEEIPQPPAESTLEENTNVR